MMNWLGADAKDAVTVYTVLANRPKNPMLSVYRGRDPAAAQRAYDAEEHAYFAEQCGAFDENHRIVGAIFTVRNAHK